MGKLFRLNIHLAACMVSRIMYLMWIPATSCDAGKKKNKSLANERWQTLELSSCRKQSVNCCINCYFSVGQHLPQPATFFKLLWSFYYWPPCEAPGLTRGHNTCSQGGHRPCKEMLSGHWFPCGHWPALCCVLSLLQNSGGRPAVLEVKSSRLILRG